MSLPIDLSVVVSVYNEEALLTKFYDTLIAEISKMAIEYEIIFVNDGSIF